MIVVTGAGGHVGNALLRALVARRETISAESPFSGPIRAVVRPGRKPPYLDDLDVEIAEADMRDPESVAAALRGRDGRGADCVFHLAGMVTITREKLERLREVNVEGTRHVIEACKAVGVKRLVYASSIHALVEQRPGVPMTEESALDPELAHGFYARTKAEATELVLAAAGEDLETVVTFPSGIVGPFDCKPSHMGDFIRNSVRGKIFAYVDGGHNFADVRDIADALIAAMERGRSGEGYVLSGHDITVPELVRLIEEVSGTPGPRLKLPLKFVRAVSFLIPAYYWITRQRPAFTTFSLDMIAMDCTMSCGKAERELGYDPRPLRETLADTVEWFREVGML